MSEEQPASVRDQLIQAGVELIRKNGYAATSVGQICELVGVSKGAFFHHFANKDALAAACLEYWDAAIEAGEQQAAFNAEPDAVKKLAGYCDHFIRVFSRPDLVKSCLIGTTVQEISESNEFLREAANRCFSNVEGRVRRLIDEAARQTGVRINSAELARLWLATIQGALVLAKASRDETVIPRSLEHVRSYILDQVAKD